MSKRFNSLEDALFICEAGWEHGDLLNKQPSANFQVVIPGLSQLAISLAYVLCMAWLVGRYSIIGEEDAFTRLLTLC